MDSQYFISIIRGYIKYVKRFLMAYIFFLIYEITSHFKYIYIILIFIFKINSYTKKWALHIACEKNHFEIVRLLLQRSISEINNHMVILNYIYDISYFFMIFTFVYTIYTLIFTLFHYSFKMFYLLFPEFH